MKFVIATVFCPECATQLIYRMHEREIVAFHPTAKCSQGGYYFQVPAIDLPKLEIREVMSHVS